MPSITTSPKPKPLPRWLQLRITASTFMRKSRRLGTGNVIVLPLHKIAKLDVPANEIAAMEFVRANTTIPVPKSTYVRLQTPPPPTFSSYPHTDLEPAHQSSKCTTASQTAARTSS